jgi:hypothetical protein
MKYPYRTKFECKACTWGKCTMIVKRTDYQPETLDRPRTCIYNYRDGIIAKWKKVSQANFS